MKKIHRSKELIIKIVNEHLKEGCSYNYLAEKYNISRNTISQWLYKYKNKNWNFERKIHKANYSELEYLRLENEILKKFLSFSRQKQNIK